MLRQQSYAIKNLHTKGIFLVLYGIRIVRGGFLPMRMLDISPNLGNVTNFPPRSIVLDMVRFMEKMWKRGRIQRVTSSVVMNSMAGWSNWAMLDTRFLKHRYMVSRGAVLCVW